MKLCGYKRHNRVFGLSALLLRTGGVICPKASWLSLEEPVTKSSGAEDVEVVSSLSLAAPIAQSRRAKNVVSAEPVESVSAVAGVSWCLDAGRSGVMNAEA